MHCGLSQICIFIAAYYRNRNRLIWRKLEADNPYAATESFGNVSTTTQHGVYEMHELQILRLSANAS